MERKYYDYDNNEISYSEYLYNLLDEDLQEEDVLIQEQKMFEEYNKKMEGVKNKNKFNKKQMIKEIADVLDTQKVETIISGEIISHPIITFRDIDEKSVKVGFVYRVRTTQLVGYEVMNVDLNISSVYDITKWDILRKGDRVDLSVITVQKSNFTDDGKALKCNVTYKRTR